MAVALDQVKERVASIRNLPGAAEEPVVKRTHQLRAGGPAARDRPRRTEPAPNRAPDRARADRARYRQDRGLRPSGRGDRHPGAVRGVARARYVARRRRPPGRVVERRPAGRQYRARRDLEAAPQPRPATRRDGIRAPGAALRRRRALPRPRRCRDGGAPRPKGRDRATFEGRPAVSMLLNRAERRTWIRSGASHPLASHPDHRSRPAPRCAQGSRGPPAVWARTRCPEDAERFRAEPPQRGGQTVPAMPPRRAGSSRKSSPRPARSAPRTTASSAPGESSHSGPVLSWT